MQLLLDSMVIIAYYTCGCDLNLFYALQHYRVSVYMARTSLVKDVGGDSDSMLTPDSKTGLVPGEPSSSQA